MPALLTGERVSFSIEFRAASPDGGATPGPIAPVQSINWSVSDPTAIRVEVTSGGDGSTGFVVAVAPNNTGEAADVVCDADVDMGAGVMHLIVKNAADDRFVVTQDPATQASSATLTFGAPEKVPA